MREWRRFNRIHKTVVNDKTAPSANDEYQLYQTLVGAWLSESVDDPDAWNNFIERIESYMLKAIREAKQNTSWINQNREYENAISSFVQKLLKPGQQNRFFNDFVRFENRIARLGLWNGLAQTVLKLTCPGVPDIYQGTEIWDFSLVDPDNRRPVDYSHRQEMFRRLREGAGNSVKSLLETPEDGRIKLYVTWRTLCLRQHLPELFQAGEYLPLVVEGSKADHVGAFVRMSAKSNVLVVVPHLLAGLLDDADVPPIGERVWQDTEIVLPFCTCSDKYRNIFTGELLETQTIDGGEKISVSKLLADFPAAVCLLG